MTYNTKNPVPSSDPRDLDDNSQALDRLLNSVATQEADRFGQMRLTWAYVEAAAGALVNPNIVALAGLSGAADRLPYFTGAGAMSLTVLTAAARTFLQAATQAAQRTALGIVIGGANGLIQAGADGLLPPSLLPPLAVNDTFVVASQAAQLALTAQRGDVAIRSDLSGAAYILTTDNPAVFANWAAIQQNLGAALQALAALTPAANQLGYFTGAGTAALTSLTSLGRSLIGTSSAATARTAITAASSGANSDITSLSGLTTPLSVAQGGTGGNSPPYTQSNAVGSVSQASGVPTGAIVETGTNANGSYTKFADGTMICEYEATSGVFVNTAFGSLYQSAATALTFPVAFVAPPKVIPSCTQPVNALCWAAVTSPAPTAAGFSMALLSVINTASARPSYIAKGRWF